MESFTNAMKPFADHLSALPQTLNVRLSTLPLVPKEYSAVPQAALTIIGLIFVVSALWTAARAFFVHFLRPGHLLKLYGQWGVVTGGTDGIGKSVATELVKEGLNVVVISRTQSKLDAVKEELEELAQKLADKANKRRRGKGAEIAPVKIETVQVDFGDFELGSDAYERVETALANKDIGVLVNNVGIGYEFPMWFHEVSEDRMDTMLRLNVYAVTFMSRIVLPGMVQRKRGSILNIASSAGVIPAPLLSLYGGTKAFVDKLSRDMNVEYGQYNITVQSQTPFWITTKLASIREKYANFTTPTPKVYAKSAVARIGYGASNFGYWFHDFVGFGIRVLSDCGLGGFVSGATLQMHKGIRKKGLKKRERKAREAAEGKKAK